MHRIQLTLIMSWYLITALVSKLKLQLWFGFLSKWFTSRREDRRAPPCRSCHNCRWKHAVVLLPGKWKFQYPFLPVLMQIGQPSALQGTWSETISPSLFHPTWSQKPPLEFEIGNAMQQLRQAQQNWPCAQHKDTMWGIIHDKVPAMNKRKNSITPLTNFIYFIYLRSYLIWILIYLRAENRNWDPFSYDTPSPVFSFSFSPSRSRPIIFFVFLPPSPLPFLPPRPSLLFAFLIIETLTFFLYRFPSFPFLSPSSFPFLPALLPDSSLFLLFPTRPPYSLPFSFSPLSLDSASTFYNRSLSRLIEFISF